ncbi:SAC3/GANP/Nin1/mts3/eIF-3 p25 family-domain-containing protein [Xylaria sp. FL0933]|nr:SAC3/GANP/Nin1/mts3/eIF-3 p25 family-domain-containing protein [Xylaria sp. FL0933]
MPNAGPQGGWGAGTTTAPPNPFNAAAPSPFGNPFAKPPPNPFSQLGKTAPRAPTNTTFGAPSTAANPFASAPSAIPKRSASPSFQQTTKSATNARNPFEPVKQESPVLGSQSSKPSANIPRSSSGAITNGSRRVAEFVQPAWPNESNKSAPWQSDSTNSNKRKGGVNVQSDGRRGRSPPVPAGMAGKRRPAPGLGSASHSTGSPRASNHSSNAHDGRSHELASKIQQQLARDRISPPQWPPNPGSHAQRQAMENFRESYKAYREKARKSLIRAGLIDDPDQRRTLQQALDFRGISEEMCPEWEKITRIIEYDIRNPEKGPDNSGDLVARPSLMVKRLARSAAGQDAPLPMDVRSFATLRKTLDYLIDDLIPHDSLLPSKHSFLWDRTRAIRIDLSVQKYNLTPDERKDLIYCLETIARFHVTALHLLSQEGFAAEDFSEQQEIEQLGKTLISLKELYDDCVEQNIDCENEAEFRGYYIVFNARNPSIKETVEGWPARLWNNDGIRTAMCLVESLQNTWSLQGPLTPFAPTELALSAASIFFSIVASPEISYTMACFAEIHFNDVRKSILQIVRKAYTRPREGPKDITPTFLKERMRFDTEDEAVDFAQKHGIAFGQDGTQRYAILNSRQPIEDPRVRHAFSRDIVERKRSGRSLPDIIHQTVFEEPSEESQISSREDGLFVDEENNNSSDASNGIAHESETNSVNSAIPSSPPISTNAQSPSNTSTLSRPQATIDSHGTQPVQAFKPPVTSVSSTLFTPTQDSKYQTAGSLPDQSHVPPLGLNRNTATTPRAFRQV